VITRRFILVDVDHTLSDAAWRDEIKPDWDAYHAQSINDEPNLDVVALVNSMAAQGAIPIAFTARPEKWQPLTARWLARSRVDIEEIIMRPKDDWRKTPEVKLSMALARFGDAAGIREHVSLILDDREDVCATFAGIGVTAMQVQARRAD